MKLQLVTLLFSAIVFFANAPDGLACSCSGREIPTKAFVQADAVFVGTVRSISREGNDPLRDLHVSFDVDAALKGKQFDVRTSSQGTACGYRFTEGERYLVFAYQSDESKFLTTGTCTRTRELLPNAVDDEVEVFRTLSKGRLEPRIFGTVYELTRGIYPLREDYWKSRQPMKGIRIIAANGKNRYEAESGADGTFRIRNVSPGNYRLTFKVPPGYKVGGDAWDESTKEERKYYGNLSVSITSQDNPAGWSSARASRRTRWSCRCALC
jgi:hypothetical protein